MYSLRFCLFDSVEIMFCNLFNKIKKIVLFSQRVRLTQIRFFTDNLRTSVGYFLLLIMFYFLFVFYFYLTLLFCFTPMTHLEGRRPLGADRPWQQILTMAFKPFLLALHSIRIHLLLEFCPVFHQNKSLITSYETKLFWCCYSFA